MTLVSTTCGSGCLAPSLKLEVSSHPPPQVVLTRKSEADRINDPPRTVENLRLAYFDEACVTASVSRDLCRAAAFLCSAPFWTALSMIEMVVGNNSFNLPASPAVNAARNFRI